MGRGGEELSLWDLSLWDNVHAAYARSMHGNEVDIAVHERFKDAVKTDRAAFTLVAALLLTICVPAAMSPAGDFNPDNNHNYEVSCIHVAAITTCTVASLLCIWNATYMFTKISLLPADKVLTYMKAVNKIKNAMGFGGCLGALLMGVNVWANVAIISIAILLCSSVYLYYGSGQVFIAIPIISLGIMTAAFNEWRLKIAFNEILKATNGRNDGKDLQQSAMGNQVVPVDFREETRQPADI